jgi:long-subunit fatty acid transport protein
MFPEMKTGARRILFLGALAGACLLFCGGASAQLVLGQYEDEAPLGTWNVLGAPSAPALGLGGLLIARAWDASASLTNPALLTTLPRFSASVAASFSAASLFKFSLVNTGVVSSSGNLTAGVVGLDHGGLAVRAGKWALAVAAAAPESYGRPAVDAGSSDPSSGYRLTLDQTGYLRLFHVGIARRLLAGLSLGLGLNVVTGRLSRTMVERTSDSQRVVTITDDKRESYRGLSLNGGLVWEASSRLTTALAFRSPYVKNAEGRSLLRYEVPAVPTDILIDAEATNAYRQPWIVGAGCSYRLSRAWSLAADLAFFGWSGYRVSYFDEPLERAFRNVVRASAGVEYLAPATMYGKSARIPFRLGFALDPQPMLSPRSSYLTLTFGTGLEWRTLAIDVSGAVGREKRSGDSLKTGKVILAIRYVFRK